MQFQIERVTDADELLAMRQAIEEVHVDPDIERYIVRLVGATRATSAWRSAPARAARWRCSSSPACRQRSRAETMCCLMMSSCSFGRH